MYENYNIGKLGEKYFINFINNNFSDIALAKDSGAVTAKENHIIGDVTLSLVRKNDGYFEEKTNTFKVEVKTSQYMRYPSFDIEAMQNGKLIFTDEYISEIDYDLIICIGKFDGNPDNLDQSDILYTIIDAKKVKELILNDKKWLANHVNEGNNGIAYINSKDFACLGSDYFYSSYRFNNILNFINSHYSMQNESYKPLSKKALYESIITSVAKEVKKALNESWEGYDESDNWKEAYLITRRLRTIFNEEFNKFGYKMFDLNNWGRVLATAYIGSTSLDRTDEALGNWGDIQPLYNKLQPILGIKDMWLEYSYEDWMWFIWAALRSILIKNKHISGEQANAKLEKLLNKSRAEIGTISSNKYLTYKQAIKVAINNNLISSENDVQDNAYEILSDYMGIDKNTLMNDDVYSICVKKLQEEYNKLRRR